MAIKKITIQMYETILSIIGRFYAIYSSNGFKLGSEWASALVGLTSADESLMKTDPPKPKPAIMTPDIIPSFPGKNNQAWYKIVE